MRRNAGHAVRSIGWFGACAAVLLVGGCSDEGSFMRYCDDTGCYACEGRDNCYPDPLPACGTDAECSAGSVCTTMGCAKTCDSDDDCREGEYCCQYGYCAPRAGDLPLPVSEERGCRDDD